MLVLFPLFRRFWTKTLELDSPINFSKLLEGFLDNPGEGHVYSSTYLDWDSRYSKSIVSENSPNGFLPANNTSYFFWIESPFFLCSYNLKSLGLIGADVNWIYISTPSWSLICSLSSDCLLLIILWDCLLWLLLFLFYKMFLKAGCYSLASA